METWSKSERIEGQTPNTTEAIKLGKITCGCKRRLKKRQPQTQFGRIEITSLRNPTYLPLLPLVRLPAEVHSLQPWSVLWDRLIGRKSEANDLIVCVCWKTTYKLVLKNREDLVKSVFLRVDSLFLHNNNEFYFARPRMRFYCSKKEGQQMRRI